MTGIAKRAGREESQSVAEGSAAATATLVVNGERRRIGQPLTLRTYLDELSLDPRSVVVELNGTILRERESFASIPLSAGDTLEIVHFVGGG